MTLLSLRHARVRYGPLEALHGLTLAAPGPGLTVLLGRNGSGRTTALRALVERLPTLTLAPGAEYRDVASPMFCGPQRVDVVWSASGR